MREQNTDQTDGLVTLLQRKLFENYHTVAYVLIVGTYLIAFTEYLYLRLVSLISPTKIIYRKSCDKHMNETIIRNELHYASTTVVFLVIGCFQIVCFFLLTISDRWLTVKRTFKHFMSLEEKLKNELVFSIKRVMYTTVLPTFLVYSMCSTVITSAIFYMVGMRDEIETTWARVIIHLFDACVIVYFLSFPLVCLFYHPKIRCRLKMCSSSVVDTPRQPNPPQPPTNNNNDSAVRSANLAVYRKSNGVLTDPQKLQHVCIESTQTTV